MLEYLRELHVGGLGGELTVQINRTTYKPIVAGRAFEELSSQGLTTLVNIAHALAHHTVAIDRDILMRYAAGYSVLTLTQENKLILAADAR